MADDDTITDTITDTGTAVEPARDLGLEDMTPVMQEGRLDLVSLEQGGKPIPMEELSQLSDRLSALGRNCDWWLGDLLNYAEAKHPSEWENLVNASSHDFDDILKMQTTARIHPAKYRLIPTDKPNSGLTWVKHTLFNEYVQTDPSKARKLMKRAASEGMTKQAINQAIRQAKSTEVDGELVDPAERAGSSVASATWHVSVSAADGATLDDLRHSVEDFIRTTLRNKGIDPTNISSRMTPA